MLLNYSYVSRVLGLLVKKVDEQMFEIFGLVKQINQKNRVMSP